MSSRLKLSRETYLVILRLKGKEKLYVADTAPDHVMLCSYLIEHSYGQLFL